jgi:hypothetical protein
MSTLEEKAVEAADRPKILHTAGEIVQQSKGSFEIKIKLDVLSRLKALIERVFVWMLSSIIVIKRLFLLFLTIL